MTLRFRSADIGWISSLLHDAGVLWDNVCHDERTQRLTVEVNRPRYESPTHQRFLGIIPIVRYQSVPALLIIPRVTEITTSWHSKSGQDSAYAHNLIELTASNDQFVMETDAATLEASLEGPGDMELRDNGPPSAQARLVDAFSSVSRFSEWAHELERLRSDP
jgi:hypothetical protein